MRYVFPSTGQQVEVPLLPGLTLRGDAWYSRAATPGGFNKTQVLAQEWTLANPCDSPRATTARSSSPRCATLSGASARPDLAFPVDGPNSDVAAGQRPRPPRSPRSPPPSSGRSPRRPGTTGGRESPRNADVPFTSESTAAFAADGLSPMERPGVLRFAAYFTESTEWAFSGELGKPSDRGVQVRKCYVLYHLEDGTVEVLEERTSNSGVAGGRFFNRAPPSSAGMGWKTLPMPGAVPQPPSAAVASVGPDGLEVGGELFFLGQTFYLVDADGFTRAWYARELGKTQPHAVDYPTLTPREYHAEHATGLGRPAGGVAYGKGGGVEVFRKSPEAGVKKQQMNKERQFFAHEGEVLKFVVTWDDQSPGGQNHEYKLCFYLSDSCAELCTLPQPGFDRFPHLLSRQPLPLNWEAMQNGEPPRYATARDLVIGSSVNVYNRVLKLVDCTQFTRHWYAKNLDLAQPPSLHVKKVKDQRTGKLKRVPPSNEGAFSTGGFGDGGFGDGEEPHGYATSTMHGYAGGCRDWERDMKVQDKTIRCRLIPVRPDGSLKPKNRASANAIEEPQRTFILTYFLPDNTLSIFEEHVNNSGVIGGAFLKRGKYKSPSPSNAARYFSPPDFYLGALIKLSAHNVMKVIEVDGASLKTMREMMSEFPFSDPAKCAAKLRAAAHEVDLAALFPSGRAPPDAFKAALKIAGLESALNEHEMLTVVGEFRDGDDVDVRSVLLA